MSRRGTAALLVLAASTAVLLSACSPATTVNSSTESPRVVSLSATGTADTADGGQTPTGFQASQSLTVTLRDLTTAGATLDAVVAAGGNAVRVDSLSTFVTDPSVALDQARAQAVGIARAQAEQYAQLLGFTLGPVASVTESSTTSLPAPMAMADAVAGAEKVPTPVEAGTTQVSVSLSIAWSIED